jgi:hypothetical protein
MLWNVSGFILYSALAAYFLKQVSGKDYWIFSIAANYVYFLLAMFFTIGADYLYVLFVAKNALRALLSSALVFAAYIFYSQTVLSYLNLTKQATNEFVLQFYAYGIIAIITAIELGRSNRQRDEMAKKAPKEKRLIFNNEFNRENYPIYKGFLILCDGAGYSVKAGQLKSKGLPEHMHFQGAILNYLLGCFYHPTTSMHSMTGDGFMLAIPWEWSEENFREIVKWCRKVVGSSVKLSDLGVPWFGDEVMSFRCTLVYAEYSATEVVIKNLGADIASGPWHILLARNSGTKNAPIALRIVLNEYTSYLKELPIGKEVPADNKSLNELYSSAIEYLPHELSELVNIRSSRKSS